MYVIYNGVAGSNKATRATFRATFDLREQLSLVALVAFFEQLVDRPTALLIILALEVLS